MASSEQLIALFESFGEQDDTRFYKTALQIAAEASRRGNRNVARDMRETIDAVRSKRPTIPPRKLGPIPIQQPAGELGELLTVSYPQTRFKSMILEEGLERTFKRLLQEHRKAHKLQEFALEPRRKLLLYGPPGTGKTMTGRAIASELNLPLFLVRFEGLLTRFMGETAAKLRIVFDAMYEKKGVYLFDEFDAIGTHRTTGNDVGEIRRVLNSFLQFIETDTSQSIIVAATNNIELIDRALFRRFDDIVEYELPSVTRLGLALKEFLAPFDVAQEIDWGVIATNADGLSYAELRRVCEDAAKEVILTDQEDIRTVHLLNALKDRRASHS